MLHIKQSKIILFISASAIAAATFYISFASDRDTYEGYTEDLKKVQFDGPEVNGLRKDFHDIIESKEISESISRTIVKGKEKDAKRILTASAISFSKYLTSPLSEDGIKALDEFVLISTCLWRYQNEDQGSRKESFGVLKKELKTPEVARIIWLTSAKSRFTTTKASAKKVEECEKL